MNAFFFLSTGRSGTQSVAHALSQAPDTICLHEPDPKFVRTGVAYAHHFVPRALVARRIRASRPIVRGYAHYGETNNRLALVLQPLRDVFPDARFVWVVRDGRDFVNSQLQRGAYQLSPWDPRTSTWERWRVRGDLTGDLSPRVWAAMDPFERCCWVWTWLNRRIEAHLADAPHLRLATAELGPRLPEIGRFLGIPESPLVLPRSNARETDGAAGHPNSVARIRTAAEWTDAEREVFRQRCGEAMDAWFPGWESAEPPPREERAAPSELDRLRAENGILKVKLAESEARVAAIGRRPSRAAAALVRSLLATARG